MESEVSLKLMSLILSTLLDTVLCWLKLPYLSVLLANWTCPRHLLPTYNRLTKHSATKLPLVQPEGASSSAFKSTTCKQSTNTGKRVWGSSCPQHQAKVSVLLKYKPGGLCRVNAIYSSVS